MELFAVRRGGPAAMERLIVDLECAEREVA
jgi:hypothetical protein